MAKKRGLPKNWPWYVSLGVIGYLIYLSRKNGNTLKGNPEGYKVSVDAGLAADILTQPLREKYPYVAHVLRHQAEKFIEKGASRVGVENGTL